MRSGVFSISMAALLVAFSFNAEGGEALQTNPPAKSASKAHRLAEGLVEDVNTQGKSIILKHGPIEHLHMGPMTMEFAVTDPKLLANVKEGDKVRFDAKDVNGTTVITSLNVQEQ